MLLQHFFAIFYLSLHYFKSSSFNCIEAIKPRTYCPNQCNNQGVCVSPTNTSKSLSCQCFPGFHGIDCSLRLCPSASAWVDYPTANNTAHANFTECSNMGTCNRVTGLCHCRNGFTGAACDMMKCPVGNSNPLITISKGITYLPASLFLTCSGKGRCMSLQDAGPYSNFQSYVTSKDYSGWDANKIHGCICDAGWEGVACDKQSCPKGDDPMTSGLPEVQYIDCQCRSCEGGLYLSWNGQQTQYIPYDANERVVGYFMEKAFTSLVKFKVKIVQGDQLCSSSGSVTQVVFELPQGPQNSLSIVTGYGLTSNLNIGIISKGARSVINNNFQSQTATTEYVECSNHGFCYHNTGVCLCMDGFSSSDGLGHSGTIADCGHQYKQEFNYTTSAVIGGPFVETELIRCPVFNGTICSGRGICDPATGVCTCNDGYGGAACANFTCGASLKWFGGDVTTNHPQTAVCGGVGDCDGRTGDCINCGGNWNSFAGYKCEKMSCYSDLSSRTCSGNGTCMSLRQLAHFSYDDKKELRHISYTAPWDADAVRGCACSRSMTIDDRFPINYHNIFNHEEYNSSSMMTANLFTDADLTKFYRGPYALAATDFTGYDCQSALCPKGDNPITYGVNEIQEIKCRANNGSFFLTFRENTTLPILFNSTAQNLKQSLDDLYTIGEVSVSITGGPRDDYKGSICNPYDNSTVLVEFLTEFGDLPLLEASYSLILDIDGLNQGWLPINITEYQKGTKEDVECSALGICDESLGVCRCSLGFQSSNSTNKAPGERGDCGYFNPLYTQQYVEISGKKN